MNCTSQNFVFIHQTCSEQSTIYTTTYPIYIHNYIQPWVCYLYMHPTYIQSLVISSIQKIMDSIDYKATTHTYKNTYTHMKKEHTAKNMWLLLYSSTKCWLLPIVIKKRIEIHTYVVEFSNTHPPSTDCNNSRIQPS